MNVGAVFVAAGVVLLTISLENKTLTQARYVSYSLIGIGLVASVMFYSWLKKNVVNFQNQIATTPSTFNGHYRRIDSKVDLKLSGDTVVFNFPRGVTMHGIGTIKEQDSADGLNTIVHIKGTYNKGKPYDHRFTMYLQKNELTLTSLQEGHVSFTFTRVSR